MTLPVFRRAALAAAAALTTVYHGALDPVVNDLVSDSGVDFYQHFGASVEYHNTDPAGHGWPTPDGVLACPLTSPPFLHGCLSGEYLLGREFPELANLDIYADTNNLVVLYPQAIASVIPDNPEGCWDWWGYDGPDFAVKTAPQMVTIMNTVTASSRDTARRRAARGVPLGSVLHAYRLGFQVIWAALADRALREGQPCLDGLVRESATVWAWVDTSSEAVNMQYHEVLIDSARHDEQQRMLLLDALLDGRLGEWKLLGGRLYALGLPEHGPYLAVSAETREAGIENLRAVGQYLRRHGVASAWRLRPDEQVGLIAVNRALSYAGTRELLAKEATGRVGISPQFDDALDVGRSLAIAAVARRCLPPGSAGVATIDDDPLATVLASAPDISGRVVRRLLGRVADLAAAERDLLLGTLRTWMDCGGNTSAAARELYCHRNTVRNRLQRVEELSGQSLSDPRGIAGLSIAAEGARLLGGELTS